MKMICLDGEPQYKSIVERDVIPLLEAGGHSLNWQELQLSDVDAVVEAAAGHDGIYVIGDQGPLPASLIERLPELRLISFVGTGAERFVDLAQARAFGVAVTNVPDFASQSVAEHAIALMFAVARRITVGDSAVRSGHWAKEQGQLIRGRKLGVVGLGSIGSKVAAMGRALGMEVYAWSRSGGPAMEGVKHVSLEELFSTCDVVSLHLLHTAETEGLVSAQLVQLMPPDAILINTARAEIVEPGAAEAALASGRLFGAGVDVFRQEPPAQDDLPPLGANTVLTPHIGFHTDEADAVFRLAAENILEFAQGRTTNRVELPA